MENRRAPFVIGAVAAVLVMQPPYAHAQQRAPVPQATEQEKAKMQEKAASRKEIDEAYKSTMKRIPDVKQSIDPWSSMRTTPQK